MTNGPLLLRVIGAVLIGVWLFGALVAILGMWRKPHRVDPGEMPKASPSNATRGAPSLPVQVLTPEAFNLSSLPIWWVDSDLRLAGANEAFAQAVGYPTALGAVRANVEFAPGARALTAQARQTNRPVVGEGRVTIDGQRHLLEIIAVPLRSGEVAHVALDETRRHAAQNDAAARARALTETLDQLAVAVALFDDAGILLHHNLAFAEMFALDRAWLDTRPDLDRVLDAMRTAGRLPEERDFTRWRAERRAWITSPADRIEESWSLPTGVLLRVVVMPRSGEGPLIVVEDETERTRLAAIRDQLLTVHAATLDHLREGVAVFGPDGKLKLFNRRFAEIVMASPQTLEATPQADVLMEHLAGLLNEPERAQGLRSLIIGATAGREARSGRITSTLGYVVEYSGLPLPDGNALLIANANPIDRLSSASEAGAV